MAIDKPKLVINYDSISSPTVKAALLNNAGIQADPQDIAQSDQAKAQMDNPQKEPTPQEHPIIKLMTSLNIKFTDLPEDSKQEVLAIIGIPSNELSPTQQGLNMDSISQQHDILSAQAGDQQAQAQMAQQGAQQQAQLQQTAEQNQAQNQLQQQSQEQASQAQASTAKSTSKPSSRPTPPTPQQPQSQPSDNITPKDQQFIGELKKFGLNDQQIGQALAMLHHGVPVEQIIKAIQGAQNG